jgi:hypothetical protein
MPRQPKPNQSDLFAAPDGGARAQSPTWQALPLETRRLLTQLMARLVLDHADRDSNLERGDGRP